MVKPVLHSVKHYVQWSIFTVLGSAIQAQSIVDAVPALSVNDPDEVSEGEVVKAVYLELWARTSEVSPGSGQLIVYKIESDSANPTIADMAALHDWDNKKNILYTTQGLFNDQDADAIALHKGWIKIPKGKQRFGLGDRLQYSFSAAGAIDVVLCGFSTYKSYS